MTTLNLTEAEAQMVYHAVQDLRDSLKCAVLADLAGMSIATEAALDNLTDKCLSLVAKNEEPQGYMPLSAKPAAFRGGSFTDSLHRAFCMADGDNRLRLEAAFPGVGAYSAKRLSE